MALAILGDDRRRDRGAVRRRAASRSSTGPARCRWARRRSRSSPSRRIATRRSRRPATRSTRRRPGRRSGRPSGSPTGTSGSATRRGPGPRGGAMKVYISVDMEGIAGVNHPRPTGSGHARYPAAVDADGRRDERRDRGRAGRRRDRRPRQRQPRRDVQPAAGAARTGGARPPGPEGVVDGRGRRSGRRLRRRAVRRLPRPGRPPARDDRPHLLRSPRSRRGSTAGRPASTASTRWSSARGASRSGWWRATTRSPRRSPTGCRGPSGSWSRTAAGGTARPRSTRPSPRTWIRPGAEGAVRAAAAAGGLELLRVDPPVVIEVDYGRGVEADHAAIVPGRRARRRSRRPVRLGRSGHRLPRLPGRQPAGVDRRSVTRLVDAPPAARAGGPYCA